eukprot:CAMPEP_0119052944 /NCGR_PEP_ID=MMETSP1177-20130426/74074_1 /TAXON_ID=2985 /ORGANISM="Ochromonas sp, Strain CCMP1899" /LENGTH=563 /DNA_ID=CAMNT_0007032693 /DNA_START=27 /DNA_END=1719 /DNA_ORIENTATION=+
MSTGFFEPFLYPTSHNFQSHSPSANPNIYLNKNKNNILSEHWALIQNSSTPAKFSVSIPIKNGKDIVSAIKANAPDDIVDLLDLHLNFGVLNSRFCILEYHNSDDSLYIHEGKNKTMPFPSKNVFHNYGYIGDSISEYKACFTLLSLKPFSALLIATADPSKRKSVNFLTPTRAEINLGQKIPINDGQFAILSGLSQSIEGIQGPPGTGKSTSIALLARHFIPRNEIILATCVQNKAVDSIAEKLGSLRVGDLPFFVLGNSDRLGIEANKWTLESQVSTDSRVVPLLKDLNNCRRREKLAEDCLKSMEGSSKKIFDKTYSRLSNLFKSLKMQRPATVWDINKSNMQILEELHGQLMELSTIASHEYSQMCSVVRAGILIRARVVLCTVATASGCGNDSFSVSDEFKPLFMKLSTIIIDEAGTAPESKLPLLLTLNPLGGVTRIIAIGDQQQLAPFSLIQGDHMGFFQRLDKALRGRIGTLTEQYRMHPVVCNFISKAFYNGKLQTPNAVSMARMTSDPIGLYWLVYAGKNAESSPPHSKSKQNVTEAELAIQAVKLKEKLEDQ